MFLFTSIAVDSDKPKAYKMGQPNWQINILCIRLSELNIPMDSTGRWQSDGNTNHMQITNNHSALLGIFGFSESSIIIDVYVDEQSCVCWTRFGHAGVLVLCCCLSCSSSSTTYPFDSMKWPIEFQSHLSFPMWLIPVKRLLSPLFVLPNDDMTLSRLRHTTAHTAHIYRHDSFSIQPRNFRITMW